MATSNQKIASVSFLVPDYDEGINYFVNKLSFTLTSDVQMGNGKRWVVVHPPNGTTGCGLVLAVPSNDVQKAALGNQAGGRVWLFLHSDKFWEDYERMKANGIEFMEEPRREPYGDVVVFRDCWGNKWDFIGPKQETA
ncbi:Glyoxalase/Bleomycin resistance protein/Dihydroxybiphenyl dioxygenase [Serendipita vermifera]|nr:Glyoxalase/Bleomycin resistance protein/Dihydroxybiphenyl dioxygenase [Serendipita vermifera]